MKFHFQDPFKKAGKGIKHSITKPVGHAFHETGKGIKTFGSNMRNDIAGITKGIGRFGDRLTSPTTMVLVACVVVGGVVVFSYLNKK